MVAGRVVLNVEKVRRHRMGRLESGMVLLEAKDGEDWLLGRKL